MTEKSENSTRGLWDKPEIDKNKKLLLPLGWEKKGGGGDHPVETFLVATGTTKDT